MTNFAVEHLFVPGGANKPRVTAPIPDAFFRIDITTGDVSSASPADKMPLQSSSDTVAAPEGLDAVSATGAFAWSRTSMSGAHSVGVRMPSGRTYDCRTPAVGGAVLAMSLLRCLHPPGGAAALTAVIGGPAVLGAGYAFPFVPVGINSLILILTGIAFHRASGHSYPHRPIPIVGHELAASGLGMPHPADIDLALADLGETFDVSREDLDLLFRRVEFHASMRAARPTGTKGGIG